MKKNLRIYRRGAMITASALMAASLYAAPPVTFTNIVYPGSQTTQAFGVNNSGTVVGRLGFQGAAFMLSGGVYSAITVPGATIVVPSSINNSGQIAGTYTTAAGVESGFTLQGTTLTTFTYPGAAKTDVFGENNSGTLVGYASLSGVFHGFVYSGTTYTRIDYPGASFTSAYGVNDAGQIIGYYRVGSGQNQGFALLSGVGGSFTQITYPGAAETVPTGINNNGQISGFYSNGGSDHAFLYTIATNTYINIDPPGATSADGFKINDSGQVVGYWDQTSSTAMHNGFITSPTLTPTVTVTATASGSGTVAVTPASAGGAYNQGSYVCFTVTPAAGQIFTGFTGGTVDNANCTTVTANLSLTANFTANPITSSSALRFIPLTPCRVVDTRTATGPLGGPSLAGNSSRSFAVQGACGIPNTALAYSFNLTVVPSAGTLGYITLWPTGQTKPLVSTLNSPDGRTKANAAIVPAGTGGAVSLYATDATDVILDVNGYFDAATDPSALAYYPITPCRVSDTRNASGPLGGPALPANSARTLPVLSSSCGIPGSAVAYALNFTAIPNGALQYLSVWPAGQTQPNVSTLNAVTGAVTANAAIVPAGTGGAIEVLAFNSSDLAVDVNGYFAPAGTGGLSLYNLAPCRIRDTRLPNGAPLFNGTITVSETGSTCGVPPDAQAVVLNATVVPSGSLTYLTLWANGATQPSVSTLNASDGVVTSNLGLIPTTNGLVNAFASGPAPIYLLLDTSGYFAP